MELLYQAKNSSTCQEVELMERERKEMRPLVGLAQVLW